MKDTPTPAEIIELHHRTREALKALKLKKMLTNIGERLALGQWLEAIELSAQAKIAPRAPLTIAHHLANASRQTQGEAQVWIDLVRQLIDASEAGVVVREELRAEAEAQGLWCDLALTLTTAQQDDTRRARPPRAPSRAPRARGGAHTEAAPGEEEARALAPRAMDYDPGAVVRVITPRDIDTRREALAELAAHIRAESPPPAFALSERGLGSEAAATRAAWLAWIEEVARAWPAPLTASDLHQISGERAPVRWLREMLDEREELAAHGLSEDRRRALASQLVDQSEAIAREALALIAAGVDERTRAAGLKLALDTITTRARLAGLDRLTLSVEATPTGQGGSLTDRARALGLSEAQLKAIGDAASTALSAPQHATGEGGEE